MNTLDPQQFARQVSSEMLALRGWRSPKLAPVEVRDDVFATMCADLDYSRMFAAGVAPADAARAIQHRAWDGVAS